VIGEVDKTEVLYSRELFQSQDDAPLANRQSNTSDGSPHFSRRLYEFVSKESSSYGAFPLRPGTHQMLAAPQLELVKQACHIFALDGDVKDEVANMKRALLRILKVRVFYRCSLLYEHSVRVSLCFFCFFFCCAFVVCVEYACAK
jgi:hypothetical protein